MNQIITSFLDNDLYKFSMQHAVLQKFPDVKVKYAFTDRNETKYPKGFDSVLSSQVLLMKYLKMTEDETKFLETITYFPKSYIDFLKGYEFDPSEVKISMDENNHLHIEIEGYWYRVILWEVPLLALISQLYFEQTGEKPISPNPFITSLNKLRKMEEHNAYFSDFGTRRRFSYKTQRTVVNAMAANANHCFTGTSNVHFAYIYGLKPIGTMAHEWIMAHAAIFGYRMANKLALEHWADVYGGNLGIALSDTFTTDAFLKSFDTKLAKLFDGVRQDSGDPYEFTDKIVDHYKNLGIDPMSKTIIFSDALTIEKATDIKEYCAGIIKSAFGIGTHLTNDVGVKPLNIVIKLSMVEINDEYIPTIKLSDDIGKHTGDNQEIELCYKTLRISH